MARPFVTARAATREPSAGVRHARTLKIHVVCSPADADIGEIVATALERSFTRAQIARSGESLVSDARALVCINPAESFAADLTRLLSEGGKAIVLGRIGPRVAEAMQLECRGALEVPAELGECEIHPHTHHDASPLVVRYSQSHALARVSPLGERPLCRFDFANEWNNLGFGRITLDGGPWSLQSAVHTAGATPIAELAGSETSSLVYAALADTRSGAALWFNRAVGPVDSLEWRVVEAFLGDYRPDDLPCLPYVSEIPYAFHGAVVARLDCDESVASSRPLVELYRDCGQPLSLALLTGQTIDEAGLAVMRDVLAHGGSVVSHSVRHAPNWGGSYEAASVEANESRAWFTEHLPAAMPVRFAVSPFHQNPRYAVAALADSGYEGFLGGIIANDPEYLLGRAGRVPFNSAGIVSLSTQCMLHGDCYRRYGDSVDMYRQSFDQHYAAESIFGYLDHPFSERYQYGWSDEATRVAAHRELIEHIGRQNGIWWASVNDVLDFLCRRDRALVEVGSDGALSIHSPDTSEQPLAIRWKGRRFAQ